MLLICIIICCVMVVVSCSAGIDDFYLDKGCMFYIYAVIFLILMLLIIAQANKPTAMDVYQGKTTLEKTYKDNIPVDSVVVWKGGEK